MDDNQCKFIHKLVHYFKPSSNRFSHQDLGHGRHVPSFVTAGLILIDWLLQSQEVIINLIRDRKSKYKI
jgi:rapamycin-insensitive companion of mTOR